MLKLTRDEKASLKHALMHLEANKIFSFKTGYGEGWYCGNKAQFVKRHIKALLLLRSLCEGKGTSKGN